MQRLIDAEIFFETTPFALLRQTFLACSALRWDDVNTTVSTTREIACAFDALCDCAFGIDKEKYDPCGMRWGPETFQSILNLTFIVNANGGARKSRFKPLSYKLAKRLGSRAILEMRTTLLSDVLDAMSKDEILSGHLRPGFSSSFQNHTESKKDHFPTTGKDGGWRLYSHFYSVQW